MHLRERIGSAWKWLYPGMRVKRWLVLLAAGLLFLSLGVSFFYVQMYRAVEFPGAVSPIVQTLTLQFMPHWLRGLLLGAAGIACVAVAVLRLSKSLVSAFFESDREGIVDVIYRRRRRNLGKCNAIYRPHYLGPQRRRQGESSKRRDLERVERGSLRRRSGRGSSPHH